MDSVIFFTWMIKHPKLVKNLKTIQHNEFELRFFKLWNPREKTFKPSISQEDFDKI
jgi:hypothetical protein